MSCGDFTTYMFYVSQRVGNFQAEIAYYDDPNRVMKSFSI